MTLRGALAFTLATSVAIAEEPPAIEDDDGVQRGAVLPGHLADLPENYWSIGIGLERFGAKVEDDNNLLGIGAMFRFRAFGPHAILMAEPSPEGYEDSRFLGGLGMRGYFPLLGTELSFGVGLHAEIRLRDHFWLAYATPFELGAVLWRKNSWDIQLFVGMRRAFAGSLIDHYLIDPNGFDNEDARDELDRIRHDDPWRGFVRLMFARRID